MRGSGFRGLGKHLELAHTLLSAFQTPQSSFQTLQSTSHAGLEKVSKALAANWVDARFLKA